MSQVLLLNPRARRRKARRKNPSPAQKRARAAFAAASRARAANPAKRRRARRRNPIAAAPMARRARRRNPIVSYRRASRRRASNPINVSGIMGMLKDAAVQGAGAVAMDMAYGYVARYLPASMQAGPGTVSAGSAVKAVITAVAGKMLSRSTNGLSMKAATGALTVQARDIVAGLLPAGTVNGLGYSVPASRVVQGSNRIGPNRLGAYVAGQPPLLSAYLAPGSSPTLSGARSRERAVR